MFAVALVGWLTRHAPAANPDSEFYRAAAITARHGHFGMTTLTSYFSGFTPIEIMRAEGLTKFVEFPLGYPALVAVLSGPSGFEWGWRLGQLVAAAALGWSASVIVGAVRDRTKRTVAACILTAVTILSPAVTTAILRIQPEFLLCALSALVIAGTVRHVRDGKSIAVAVVAAAAAPVVRFVGIGLVVLPLLAMRGVRTRTRVLVGAAMVTPALANQLWVLSSGASRVRGINGLGWDYLRRATITAEGWLWADGAVDPRIDTSTSIARWVAFAVVVTVLIVMTGAVLRPSMRPTGAWVPLAGAGCLLAAIFGGMVVADRFVRPDTRQLLPVQLCVLWALAAIVVSRWTAWPRAQQIVAVTAAIVWVVVAVAPWSSVTKQIRDPAIPNASAMRAAAESVGARLLFADVAGTLHQITGSPAAYLPFDPNIITGERVDEIAQTQALVCGLAQHHAAVFFTGLPTYHNWGPIVAVLDQGVALGLLHLRDEQRFRVYEPTGARCPNGKFPVATP